MNEQDPIAPGGGATSAVNPYAYPNDAPGTLERTPGAPTTGYEPVSSGDVSSNPAPSDDGSSGPVSSAPGAGAPGGAVPTGGLPMSGAARASSPPRTAAEPPFARAWSAGPPTERAPVPLLARRGLGSGAIIAIVAGALALLLVVGGLSAATGFLLGSEATASGSDVFIEGDEMPLVEGVVVDEAGDEIPGVGDYGDPAPLAGSGLLWTRDDGSTLTVVVDEIDWNADAEIAAADPGASGPTRGTRFVLVTLSGTFVGEGHMDVWNEVYLDIETADAVYFADESTATPARPLWRQGGIADGETATGQVLVEVPRDVDPADTVVSVAVAGGDSLYLSGE